jgi:exopolysaccharide production protein ExoY
MLDTNQLNRSYLVDPYTEYSGSGLVDSSLSGGTDFADGLRHVVENHQSLKSRSYEMGKRAFDVAFAVVFLFVAFPFMAVLAVALKIDSPGTLFFMQQRVGRHGRPFKCIKFRTMHMDADRRLSEILATSPEARREWEADHKLRNDPRVSRLGGLVRKLSLDELPQLINILRGEMSVVGPRPIVRNEVPKYGVFFANYCSVKPGLTGLWQVSGRNDVTYDERVQMDVEYSKRASLMLDISVVFRTLPAVVFARGSY